MSAHDTKIAWREWGEDAFAEAKAQDRPVLLDIGAVWCHWCHVMDDGIAGDPVHTGTYSDPDVQRRIAEHFIPIKVDNDRRPDVNARYNMGGWPTTAFLTPSGDILYGETYVTPARMTALLDYIADVYHTKRGDVHAQAAEMRARRAADEHESADSIPPTVVDDVCGFLKRDFDFAFGGFGDAPKFPHPAALALAIERYAETRDPDMQVVADKTLRAMSGGGMYDRFAGGFFRYSTTRDWSIPHYEKMLEDNARLTMVYAAASAVFEDRSFMEPVHAAHEWLLTTMYDAATGTFAGSQDADAEDLYYGQPLDIRATLPTPFIDRTVYVDWNALMVSSLLARWRLEGGDDLLATACRTYGFLRDRLADAQDDGRLLVIRHYWDGTLTGGPLGLLGDQTDFASAALDLYEATGGSGCLSDGIAASEVILARLEDNDRGGFYDLAPDDSALGEMTRPRKDMTENASTALLFSRLTAITGDERWISAADRALRLFTDQYPQQAFFAAQYARAARALRQPPIHVVVAGDGPDTEELRRAAWSLARPGLFVERLDSSAAAVRSFPPAPDGAARAYVCIGTVCHAPVSDPITLRATIWEAAAGSSG